MMNRADLPGAVARDTHLSDCANRNRGRRGRGQCTGTERGASVAGRLPESGTAGA